MKEDNVIDYIIYLKEHPEEIVILLSNTTIGLFLPVNVFLIWLYIVLTRKPSDYASIIKNLPSAKEIQQTVLGYANALLVDFEVITKIRTIKLT